MTKSSKAVIDNSMGPATFERDGHGLLKNIEYVFNEDGSVNWRAMVGHEHLFPNKNWFQQRNQDLPSSGDDLRDEQLLIKLSGIKELARLRGFSDVYYEVVKCELDHVAVICHMRFIPNYETGGETISFQDIANATLDNTYDFGQNFLETIACNRSFVRCVRNFLNIHIVGSDEMGPSSPKKSAARQPGVSPQAMLDSHFEGDFEEFKSTLRDFWQKGVYKNESIKSWGNFSDIPVKDARVLLKLVKEN